MQIKAALLICICENVLFSFLPHKMYRYPLLCATEVNLQLTGRALPGLKAGSDAILQNAMN